MSVGGNDLPDETTQERVGRNDAVFREANEGLGDYAADAGLDGTRVPFICECADPTCRELLRLTLDEYEHVRTNPRWFFNAPGHEVSARGAATVVERHDSYVIVEKLARAGEVAEELDSRRPA